ncbi:MAG: peroxiredoxin family protein [Nannocystaceae bacterium]
MTARISQTTRAPFHRSLRLLALALTVGAGLAVTGCAGKMTADAAPPVPAVTTSGLTVGSSAPAFTLASTTDADLSLEELRGDGPKFVVFYRGDWCPICRKQLRGLDARRSELQARGADVIAISVDDLETSAGLVDRLDLSFPLLSDTELTTVRSFGVEDTPNEISKPAAFLVDTDGTILFAKVGESAKDRADLDQVLQILDAR